MLDSIITRASSFAENIDSVIILIAILGGFWLFVAEGILFYLIFKYRRKKGQPAQYISGEKKEEKKWIQIPHYLIFICDIVIIVVAVQTWYHVKQNFPPPEQTVRIIGQQWAWTFVQPGLDGQLGTADDITTVDELHVKIGITYHFKLESKDVVHSFSVPVFRLKQDAIPGREITGWFKPIKTGKYDIQCAEMCGIGHGIMNASIFIESAQEHEAWMLQNRSG